MPRTVDPSFRAVATVARERVGCEHGELPGDVPIRTSCRRNGRSGGWREQENRFRLVLAVELVRGCEGGAGEQHDAREHDPPVPAERLDDERELHRQFLVAKRVSGRSDARCARTSRRSARHCRRLGGDE